jgi:hypothetical protein
MPRASPAFGIAILQQSSGIRTHRLSQLLEPVLRPINFGYARSLRHFKSILQGMHPLIIYEMYSSVDDYRLSVSHEFEFQLIKLLQHCLPRSNQRLSRISRVSISSVTALALVARTLGTLSRRS